MAVKKGLTTLFLLFIYVLGSRITLPFVDLNSRDFLGGSTAYLAFSTALLGGNLRSLSLFSIGLSPWMSSMILWQLLSFSKKLNISSGAVEVQDSFDSIFSALIESTNPTSLFIAFGNCVEYHIINSRSLFPSMVIRFKRSTWSRWLCGYFTV